MEKTSYSAKYPNVNIAQGGRSVSMIVVGSNTLQRVMSGVAENDAGKLLLDSSKGGVLCRSLTVGDTGPVKDAMDRQVRGVGGSQNGMVKRVNSDLGGRSSEYDAVRCLEEKRREKLSKGDSKVRLELPDRAKEYRVYLMIESVLNPNGRAAVDEEKLGVIEYLEEMLFRKKGKRRSDEMKCYDGIKDEEEMYANVTDEECLYIVDKILLEKLLFDNNEPIKVNVVRFILKIINNHDRGIYRVNVVKHLVGIVEGEGNGAINGGLPLIYYMALVGKDNGLIYGHSWGQKKLKGVYGRLGGENDEVVKRCINYFVILIEGDVDISIVDDLFLDIVECFGRGLMGHKRHYVSLFFTLLNGCYDEGREKKYGDFGRKVKLVLENLLQEEVGDEARREGTHLFINGLMRRVRVDIEKGYLKKAGVIEELVMKIFRRGLDLFEDISRKGFYEHELTNEEFNGLEKSKQQEVKDSRELRYTLLKLIQLWSGEKARDKEVGGILGKMRKEFEEWVGRLMSDKRGDEGVRRKQAGVLWVMWEVVFGDGQYGEEERGGDLEVMRGIAKRDESGMLWDFYDKGYYGNLLKGGGVGEMGEVKREGVRKRVSGQLEILCILLRKRRLSSDIKREMKVVKGAMELVLKKLKKDKVKSSGLFGRIFCCS